MLKLAVFSFLQLFLITLSSRFANRGQYIPQFFISFCIGILWCNIFKGMLTMIENPVAIFVYSIGSAFGGVIGIIVHKRWLSTKKESKEW